MEDKFQFIIAGNRSLWSRLAGQRGGQRIIPVVSSKEGGSRALPRRSFMKKTFGYCIALTMPLWGQAVSPDINSQPTRQFGHPSLVLPPTQNTPNLVEGREFYIPGQMAFDSNGNLYVVDIANNRVLAFKPGSATAGHMADLVIGQQDFQSTLGQGNPNGTFTTGLSSPVGLAVDSSGNVYVADAGNNRILRFPTPFSQTSLPLQPDLVIGQKTFSSGNLGNMSGNCAANTLFFSSNGTAYISGMTIDASQNLWVTDPLNYRVLMYPVSSLTPNAPLPAATTVVGQAGFTTCTPPSGANNQQTSLTGLVQPAGLAFDSTGNLYIADAYARVLYYTAPIASQGQVAARVLGIVPPVQQGQPNPTYPNQYSLGVQNAAGNLIAPNGVFTSGNHLFVADTGANRIVEYDVPVNWPSPTTAAPSPPSVTVIGQVSLGLGLANQGLGHATQYTLSSPYSGTFYQGQMWVSDSGNNRVLAYTATNGVFTGASTVVGQTDFIYNAPNLIEGRELFLTASSMVIDNSSSPPHLYVADPGNNRILCFKDARIVGKTTPPALADLVIGQPDLKTSQVNYPNGMATPPTQTGLNSPIGVVVDNNGNLYVADSGNGRVLRFAAPFSQNLPAGTAQSANLVLGQNSYTSVIRNADANSMYAPWGLALFAGSDANATPLAGGLAVSDSAYNRVLIFKKQAGGDFTNGEAAYLAIGQSNFTSVTAGSGSAALNSPRGIASDTSDRLYVADLRNNRIIVFSQAPENTSSGPTSATTYTGFSQPQAVAVNPLTTELWVADSGSGVIDRFPEYTTCVVTCSATAQISTAPASPIGLALDVTGNVIVGDTFNHLTLFFAQAFVKNAATFSAYAGLAPGMLAALGRGGLQFNIPDAPTPAPPWPFTLSDLNITVNGTLAPIFATNNNYGAVYFQVPSNAPTSGTANFVVTQVSTGAVLGVGQFQMAKADPGFFTSSQNGLGQVAAINDDGTVNSPANPVSRSGTHYISFYLTGQGVVPGGPPDGQGASGAVNTPVHPTVIMNSVQLPDSMILYSGLAPGFPGLWQLNLMVPSTVPPASNIEITLLMDDIPANVGGNSQTYANGLPGPDVQKILTTFATKQ
jgi:uncharacterized protein (TIGR03437 family)